jgi:putative addiction module killer protein
MPELRQYFTRGNRSPYGEWFARLDNVAAAKVVVALARLEAGNTSNVKSVGEGVQELRIHFGPGYRVYCAWDGQMLWNKAAAGSGCPRLSRELARLQGPQESGPLRTADATDQRFQRDRA